MYNISYYMTKRHSLNSPEKTKNKTVRQAPYELVLNTSNVWQSAEFQSTAGEVSLLTLKIWFWLTYSCLVWGQQFPKVKKTLLCSPSETKQKTIFTLFVKSANVCDKLLQTQVCWLKQVINMQT